MRLTGLYGWPLFETHLWENSGLQLPRSQRFDTTLEVNRHFEIPTLRKKRERVGHPAAGIVMQSKRRGKLRLYTSLRRTPQPAVFLSTSKLDHIIAPCLNIEHHTAIFCGYIMRRLALAANGNNFLPTRSPQPVLAIHHRMQHGSGCLSFLPRNIYR